MSDLCYPVLVFWSLGSLLLATDAALVIDIQPANVTEETTGIVNITCILDYEDIDVQTVLKIGFRKDNCNKLVSLVGSTISYDDANYADINKYYASGSIEQEVGRSDLRLSIRQPDQSESGVYTCRVGYLTKDMMFGELQASSSLTVKGLDLTELAKELSDAKDQLNQLKSQQESRATNIAFHASLNSDTSLGYIGKTIHFEHVDVNEGNAYDGNTGVFTTPRSGVYQFSTTFHTTCKEFNDPGPYLGGCVADVHIVAGSKPVGTLTTAGVYHETQVSVTGIAKLSKGVKVRVATRPTLAYGKPINKFAVLYGRENMRLSVFSGFFIK